jgi:hypothetical protein
MQQGSEHEPTAPTPEIRRRALHAVAREQGKAVAIAPPAGAGASPGHEKPAAAAAAVAAGSTEERAGRRGDSVMGPHLDDAKRWYDRAEECRRKAEDMISPDAREVLLGIAASYEGMATRAEARERRG